jgi:hypothetical protein
MDFFIEGFSAEGREKLKRRRQRIGAAQKAKGGN